LSWLEDEIVTKQVANPDFETSLQQLEQLVQQMERGKLTLEQSLAAFEQGVKLNRACQQALDTAEQKVNLLLQNEQGEISRQPFNKKD
jgi:exodeoxyribonuclease VII small subunit